MRNQSLNGVLLRLWRPELNGLPVAAPGLPFRAAWLFGQALVLLALAALVLNRKGRLTTPEREWTAFSLIVLLMPLVQPYAWEHHFAQAIMIVPVAVHLVSRHQLGWVASLVLGAVFAVYLLLEYPAFVVANAAAPSALKASLGLQLAASITAIAAILTAVLLASSGGRFANMRLVHLARFMRIQHR